MSFRAPVGKETTYELPKPGMIYARCVAVIDLGTHLDKHFPIDDKGKENFRHLIRVHFELDETMEYNGEKVPMVITQQYRLSAHEKANLRKDLESWYGKKFDTKQLEAVGGFDLEKILGKPALLNIQHSEDGKYANIKSINPPMKGVEVFPQYYPSRLFSLASPDADVFATLSSNTRKKISECEEVKSGQVKLPTITEKAAAPVAVESDEPF